MLRELTARQYLEWLAFYGIDPWGEQRADLRAGIVAATMSNRWRGKHEEAAEPVDFMPFRQEPEQTPQDIKRTLKSILARVKHG